MKNVSFAEGTTIEQFAPVTVTKDGRPNKTVDNQADLDDLLSSGWKLAEAPKPAAGSSRSTGVKAPREPRKNLGREGARQLSDANLAFSLGIPSAIADAVKTSGSLSLPGKVLAHPEQWSKNTGKFYPSTQVQTEYKGNPYTFCLLFVDVDEQATVRLDFSVSENLDIRSGVEVKATV